ncbi:MAG: transcriptional regulator GlxA family with amidase domain [Candidatus Latescibacterota bacterium]|jgi:transcriptional regulator GlxA family with amidase domain
MNSIKHAVMVLFFAMLFANSGVSAAPEKIGILVFDGFLTSDVTVPIEVFGAAAKKEWFAQYEVVVISATKNKQVVSEEGLRLVADITIYDEVALDVFIVPSAYEMDALLQDEKLIDYIRKQTQSVSWLASNCSGAFLLAAAGVLDGKKATTWAGGGKWITRGVPKNKGAGR